MDRGAFGASNAYSTSMIGFVLNFAANVGPPFNSSIILTKMG